MISITSSKPFVPVPAISKTFLQSGNSNQVKFPEADSFSYNSKSSEPKFSGLFDNLLEKRLAKALKVKVVKDDDGEIVSGSNRADDSFHNFSFQDAWLPQVDFNHTNFSHGSNFQGCLGINSDFSDSNLPAANFRNSILSGADYSEASLPGANFDVCDLQSISILPNDLTARTVNKWGYTIGADLLHTFGNIGKWLGVDLDGAQTQAAKFTKAKLAGASFRHADLRGVDFTHSQLPLADFEGADVRNADFSKARILGAKFKNARLEGAKINLMDALEREIRSGNSSVQAYINLGELLHASSMKLNIHNTETANQIHKLFEARDKGRITQSQLEASFKKHLDAGERQRLPVPQMLPDTFNKVYQDLL